MVIETNIPPWLFSFNGKTYLMPIWKQVDSDFDLSTVQQKSTFTPTVQPEYFSVTGSKGDEYTVTKDEKERWSCNCWGYKRAKDGKCKHIKSVINGIIC